MPDWATIGTWLKSRRESPLPSYMDAPQLSGSWVVTADIHVPYYSEKWVDQMVRTAKDMGIKRLITIGDVSNQESASRFVNLVPELPLGVEAKETQAFTEFILKHFDEWFILPGNHDTRLLKVLSKALKVPMEWADIAEWMFPGAKFHPVPYSYATLNGQTRLTHPEKNYTRIQGRRAQRLANEILHMNVISAGGHLCGMVIDNSGKYWAIDLPPLVDETKVPYKMLYDTLFPRWTNGFAVVEHYKGKDYPHLFGDILSKPAEGK